MVLNAAINKPKPFIIWTLQRTGGTNLAQQLTVRSKLQGTQHEPFNQGRIFGHITEQWVQEKNLVALEQAIQEICQRGVIIKHCVETVPWAVTESLAKAAVAAGYGHLFLYRKNPVNRLLSLQFAKLSGIWGLNLKDKKELSEKIFAEPLPITELVKHESRCVQRLNATWSYLLERCAGPVAFAYEDIYQSDDPNQPIRELHPLLDTLGLSKGSEDDRLFISETIGTGDQGTRDKYCAFAGIDQLEHALRSVPAFTPTFPKGVLEIKPLIADIPWVIHAAIDELPSAFVVGKPCDIGGVVVLSEAAPEGCSVEINGADKYEIKRNIQSPWIAIQYPNGKNSNAARFRIRNICVREDSPIEIFVADGLNKQVPLFHVMVAKGNV
jgi:hypothetical protein